MQRKICPKNELNQAWFLEKRCVDSALSRMKVVLCFGVLCAASLNSNVTLAKSPNYVRLSAYSSAVERESDDAPSPANVADDAPNQSLFQILPDYPESQVRNFAAPPKESNRKSSRGSEIFSKESAVPNLPKGETLTQAIQIAVEQSRTQRALALRRGASQSTANAARSLKNPKINTTTAYVGMLNQPKAKTEIDLAGAVSSISDSLIPGSSEALAPILDQLPHDYQIATPVLDRNFVATATSVTVPIYLGGRVEALTQEAEALAQAVEAGEEVDLQKVKLETTEAFYLVLRMQSLRQVAVEAIGAAQSHLADSERMENVGLLTRNVVLAARVAYSEAKQAELRIATAQSMAETAYNRILWRPLDAPVVLLDDHSNDLLEDVDALMNEALSNRGEIKILNAEGRVFQAQAKLAQADVKPQVAAVGAYTYIENSHMTGNSNATAAVGVTWTPFDGGTSRARQQAARQNAMAAARMREEAESNVRMQVRQAWLLQKEAHERVEIAQIAVEQAEENYRVATRGFQEGTLNHTEALDAATMLTAAKSSYTNAQYDAILATERLKSAVGSL